MGRPLNRVCAETGAYPPWPPEPLGLVPLLRQAREFMDRGWHVSTGAPLEPAGKADHAARRARIKAMLDAGVAEAEIAERIGTTRDNLRHVMRRAGFVVKRPPRKTTPQAKVDALLALVASGKSKAAAAREVGLRLPTAYGILRRLEAA